MQRDDAPNPKLRGKTVKATTMLIGAQPDSLFRELIEGLFSASR
jgi:hypothetical protein